MTLAPGEQPVSRLEMLGDRERERLIEEWSRPALPVGGFGEGESFVPVQVLIGRTAAEHPAAVAVTTPSQRGEAFRLTYGELDRRAGDTAARLRALGVGEGSVVVLCLEKSPELVIMLLAVLKTGAAYLPLRPGDPVEAASRVLCRVPVRNSSLWRTRPWRRASWRRGPGL